MAFGELAAGLLLRALEGPFHKRAERLGRRCVWWSSTVVLWGVSAVIAVALFTGQSTPAQAAGQAQPPSAGMVFGWAAVLLPAWPVTLFLLPRLSRAVHRRQPKVPFFYKEVLRPPTPMSRRPAHRYFDGPRTVERTVRVTSRRFQATYGILFGLVLGTGALLCVIDLVLWAGGAVLLWPSVDLFDLIS